MACSWLRRLGERYPDLADRARELNRRDGFVMWEDDPVAQAKWRRKRAKKEQKRERRKERKEKKSRKDQQAKEKWGKHRTEERRKDETAMKKGSRDVLMHEAPPDY